MVCYDVIYHFACEVIAFIFRGLIELPNFKEYNNKYFVWTLRLKKILLIDIKGLEKRYYFIP